MTHLMHKLAAQAAVGATDGSSFWFPAQASTVAADVDWIYGYIYWVSVFFVLLIVGLGVLFILKFRSSKHEAAAPGGHSTALEITWTVIPTILVAFMFYFGLTGYLDMRTPPQDAQQIGVTGIKWAWSFTYPNGHTDSVLHVPIDEPVQLTMTSEDVIHSFYVPAFRVKQDVVPGRYTHLWFTATQAGEHHVFCTEYCGTKHSEMLTKVVVHPPGEYEKWLATTGDKLAKLSPAEAGKELFTQNGCGACHSTDGRPGVGPSMKGAWGNARELADGSTATFDENYVRKSILEPVSQVVKGFPPAMPTFQGRIKDQEITAIIEYLKTLK